MSSLFKSLVHHNSKPRSQSLMMYSDDLCETCGKREKYVEKDGTVHPYCGRTCAKNQQLRCKLPNCKENGKSTYDGYCSTRHSREGQKGQAPCHRCNKHHQAINGLCAQCHSQEKESWLREVNPKDPKFNSVVSHVVKEWKSAKVVEVHKLYEIFLPREVYSTREAYRMNLEALGKARQARTFRGAQCICDLGVTGSSFCKWASCGICSIIKSSFTTLEFGETSNPGRFGKGIYTYFDPSMADAFATSSLSSPFRAILLCEVNIPGPDSNASKSPFVVKSYEDDHRMFVSSAEAIVPKFVILYKKGT